MFEADELLTEMRDAEHRVSKATIYRTLKHLLESKIIKEVLIDSSRAHYQLAFGQKSTGHLVCLETNQIIEFPTERARQAMMKKVCKEHGYEPLSHRFVIYGSSPAAQATEAGRRRLRHYSNRLVIPWKAAVIVPSPSRDFCYEPFACFAVCNNVHSWLADPPSLRICHF